MIAHVELTLLAEDGGTVLLHAQLRESVPVVGSIGENIARGLEAVTRLAVDADIRVREQVTVIARDAD